MKLRAYSPKLLIKYFFSLQMLRDPEDVTDLERRVVELEKYRIEMIMKIPDFNHKIFEARLKHLEEAIKTRRCNVLNPSDNIKKDVIDIMQKRIDDIDKLFTSFRGDIIERLKSRSAEEANNKCSFNSDDIKRIEQMSKDRFTSLTEEISNIKRELKAMNEEKHPRFNQDVLSEVRILEDKYDKKMEMLMSKVNEISEGLTKTNRESICQSNNEMNSKIEDLKSKYDKEISRLSDNLCKFGSRLDQVDSSNGVATMDQGINCLSEKIDGYRTDLLQRINEVNSKLECVDLKTVNSTAKMVDDFSSRFVNTSENVIELREGVNEINKKLANFSDQLSQLESRSPKLDKPFMDNLELKNDISDDLIGINKRITDLEGRISMLDSRNDRSIDICYVQNIVRDIVVNMSENINDMSNLYDRVAALEKASHSGTSSVIQNDTLGSESTSNVYSMFVGSQEKAELEKYRIGKDDPRNKIFNFIEKNEIAKLREVLLSDTSYVRVRQGTGLLNTPLLYAISVANYDACEVLLELGADVNEIDSMGMTPLIKAAQIRNGKIIDLLRSNGADMNKAIRGMYTVSEYLKKECPDISI